MYVLLYAEVVVKKCVVVVWRAFVCVCVCMCLCVCVTDHWSVECVQIMRWWSSNLRQ